MKKRLMSLFLLSTVLSSVFIVSSYGKTVGNVAGIASVWSSGTASKVLATESYLCGALAFFACPPQAAVLVVAGA